MQTFAQQQSTITFVSTPHFALDCETAALLRRFLLPIFEKAKVWEELRQDLLTKGYEIAFRDDLLVLCNLDTPQILRVGSLLSASLHSRIERLGRAQASAHRKGGVDMRF
ncbi:hypothetical protein P775_03030 [Puniceibacterium antarcticum]|uniref:Uncharacterized protein n=1 Tax=Puniceibacterium antarcticum TaxID=1206336 RepID=A0A2G8RKP2_9RHOB|nr:hypothetical protein [Puniceibacterium antarcticum]PIL21648.1 hypothetical protein P775_03030 [Puniceibacterium antarcticum]